MAPRSRFVLLAVAFVLATVAAVVVIAFNRGQEIILGVGGLQWRGEAIHAIYLAAVGGLVLMFLVGLPADLAARKARRRLAARVRDLERRLGERSRPPSPDPEAAGDEPERTASEIGSTEGRV